MIQIFILPLNQEIFIGHWQHDEFSKSLGMRNFNDGKQTKTRYQDQSDPI
jgi:hypothetical protein